MARPLARLLHDEATRRGLRAGADLPDARDLFELVRDFPYARASAHDPDTVIREWRGTCSTKHELLAALYAELGLPTTLYACTQEIRLPPGAPPELAGWQGEPVIDVHNYLVLHEPGGDRVLDATWPLSTRTLGLGRTSGVRTCAWPARRWRPVHWPLERTPPPSRRPGCANATRRSSAPGGTRSSARWATCSCGLRRPGAQRR